MVRAQPVLCWVHPDTSRPLIPFERRLLRLGRDDGMDIVVDDAQASRQHAEIWRTGPLFLIKDLQSTNGVYVNGAKVQETALQPGDLIRIGESLAVFCYLPGETAAFRELAPGLFGGPNLAPLIERAAQAASSHLPVVLEGETGTGKEVFARALHALSGRKGPMLAVNCAGFTENIAAAELFGYRKGAFTGADENHIGQIRAAQGGTLMLDEVVDLPASVQAKLLRVLQEREVLPVGDVRPQPIDVRFVAAAQVSLAAAVAEGRFRPDLRARLEGLVLSIPPLRDRPAEIVPLFMHLLRKYAGASSPSVQATLLERLHAHRWPMNVREMDALVQRLLVLRAGRPILKLSHLLEALPELGAASSAGGAPAAPNRKERKGTGYSEAEIQAFVAALERHGGNISRAASELKITRQKAYRLLQAYRPDGAR